MNLMDRLRSSKSVRCKLVTALSRQDDKKLGSKDKHSMKASPDDQHLAKPGEILAWASYDVANSTYATVIATAVYNAYFVKNIAPRFGEQPSHDGYGTFLLAVIIAVSSFLVVLSAPILGTIADATATKKKLLFISTGCCVVATALLATVEPGQYVLAMILLIIANFAFGTGEDFIASFLPELAPREKMGRVSAIGWGAGYVGGLVSLGAALAYMKYAEAQNLPETVYVPKIVAACAVLFAVMCLPTFLWLKERAEPEVNAGQINYIQVARERLALTFSHAQYYRDLFNILLAIFVYTCGSGTIVHIASVYAREVLHFTPMDSVIMVLVVDLTAAVGAFVFGIIQDRIGSVKTLTTTLSIWLAAVVVASVAREKWHLYVSGVMIGIAMGSSGSVGRALVGRFAPHGRSAEFLGLWGLAMKAAAGVGVIVFGITSMVTADMRVGLLIMSVFFIGGILLVRLVDEDRGVYAAAHLVPPDKGAD
jgi:UMF1 family MFS transporter